MAQSLNQQSTAALVRAAQHGNRDAFGALYERFAKPVRGVLYAHVPADDVADVLQEVFLAALRQLDGLRDRDAFGGWVCAIARNHARMQRRRDRETVELPETLVSGANADDELHAREVLAAVHRIPERFREALLLRLIEGFGGAEIAEHLQLSHGTVRVYLHQGMALLREELGGAHE